MWEMVRGGGGGIERNGEVRKIQQFLYRDEQLATKNHETTIVTRRTLASLLLQTEQHCSQNQLQLFTTNNSC